MGKESGLRTAHFCRVRAEDAPHPPHENPEMGLPEKVSAPQQIPGLLLCSFCLLQHERHMAMTVQTHAHCHPKDGRAERAELTKRTQGAACRQGQTLRGSKCDYDGENKSILPMIPNWDVLQELNCRVPAWLDTPGTFRSEIVF